MAILTLRSLKYIWVQGYNAKLTGVNLLAMECPFWNIEFTPSHQDVVDGFSEDSEVESTRKPTQILAYYSLAGRRTTIWLLTWRIIGLHILLTIL